MISFYPHTIFPLILDSSEFGLSVGVDLGGLSVKDCPLLCHVFILRDTFSLSLSISSTVTCTCCPTITTSLG